MTQSRQETEFNNLVTEQNLLEDINNLEDTPSRMGQLRMDSMKKLSTITNAKFNLRKYGL